MLVGCAALKELKPTLQCLIPRQRRGNSFERPTCPGGQSCPRGTITSGEMPPITTEQLVGPLSYEADLYILRARCTRSTWALRKTWRPVPPRNPYDVV